MAARSLAIAHTAIYDAWAAYDNTAKPTNGARASGTAADQQLAISHAAYQTLTALFGSRAQFDALVAAQNSVPDDPAPAAQVGRRAAADILTARANDGVNAPSYTDPTDWNNIARPQVFTESPTPMSTTPGTTLHGEEPL